MIIKCTAADSRKILGFIGEDHCRCLYLYMDLLKYGFDTPFVSTWRQESSDGSLAAVWLKYHSGMHVYAPRGYIDVEEATRFVRSEHPAMLCGVPDALNPLEKDLSEDGYAFLDGTVCKYHCPPNTLEIIDMRMAECETDFVRIGEMLYADEEYSASYKPGELAEQLHERQRLGQGRSYVVEREGQIVAHVCIAAECERFSLLSGAVTDQNWRRRGLASRLIFTVAEVLRKAGKELYSLYYNPTAKAMHGRAGFIDCCAWGRLYLKMH